MQLLLLLICRSEVCRVIGKLLPIAFLFAFAAFAVSPGLPVSAAVDLTYFTAQVEGAAVRVSWRTATERGNMGFRLLKSTSTGGPWENKGEFHSTCPGCILGSNYTFSDTAVSAGKTYYYKLESIDTGKPYGPVSVRVGAPATTATPTRTRTSTSAPPTKTSAPTVANSATPRLAAAATGTRLVAPATNTTASTATRPASATPSPQASPSRSMQGTPTRKIAYAVDPSPKVPASPPASRAQPTFAAPVPTLSSQELNESLAPTLDTTLEAGHSDDTELESGAELSEAAPDWRPLFKLALYGLAGIFGLGAVLFGALAIGLLARSGLHG